MLLTIKDIAARLKVKDKTLYAWAAQGRIPTLKINGVIRFEPEAIDRWLQDCQMLTERSSLSAKRRRLQSARDVDHLIERARRAVYTHRGETRPIASPFREEEANGSL
ncbi:MAG: helix-turn-helix domain-containing protein [Nitrospira sp.]|nr:helix-turn-helix domain-containing protein [Nitrospira sp.]MBX3328003.1 helix-turn-helix domain-containing protein [Nitrospira sp.]